MGVRAGRWRRRRHPDRWKRSEEIHLALRPGELADLREIAEVWRCPTSTVAWVILHDALRRMRSAERQYGDAGLGIAAAVATRLAERAAARAATSADERT